MARHLVICEYDEKHVKKATLSAISAARFIPGEVHALVVGLGVGNMAQSIAPFVNQVHVVEHEYAKHLQAEFVSSAAAQVAQKIGATHLWGAATVFGKETLPRVAVRLDAGMASDIQEVIDEKTYKRPLWAGNLIGTVQLQSSMQVLSVRATEFKPADPLSQKAEIVSFAISAPEKPKTRFLSFDAVVSKRPELTEAKVVVSGGRGLKGPEGFTQIIEPLADALKAAIGASRAVCDAGWVPNDWQVGQTGKVVAPDLYIAVGISGAIQHVAGIKGSKVIVAINKDPEAPIFQVADYGLVGDAFVAVPELLKKLQS